MQQFYNFSKMVLFPGQRICLISNLLNSDDKLQLLRRNHQTSGLKQKYPYVLAKDLFLAAIALYLAQ